MSFRTLIHTVSISRDQLLDLFLDLGDLLITLDGQTTTLEGIHDRRLVESEVDGEERHSVKIHGFSDSPNIIYVNGKGTLILNKNSEVCILELELHLQDGYE